MKKSTNSILSIFCLIVLISLSMMMFSCDRIPDENPEDTTQIQQPGPKETGPVEREVPGLDDYLEENLFRAFGHKDEESAPDYAKQNLSGFFVADYDFFKGYAFNTLRGDAPMKLKDLIRKYHVEVVMYKNEWDEYQQCPFFKCDDPAAMLAEYAPIQLEYNIFGFKLNSPFIEDYYIYKDKIAVALEGKNALVFYKMLDIVEEKDGYLQTKDGTTFLTNLGTKAEIVIPKNITTIASHAFNDQTVPTKKITFEDGSALTKIAPYAFRACRELEYLYIPMSTTTIGSRCISHLSQTKLEIVTPCLDNKADWDSEWICTDSNNYSITYGFGSDAQRTIEVPPTQP